ncbi:alpha/beta hydrolase fold domain-containing protein [Algoriphagus aestuariicola]|uniref:Pectinesterase n=1 Tax=Algoriphagus aestuariicola TaxID=1852016 RepID=A0ABS3BW57_9BACT|nr:pectinesterase family protein [Algoriphagus aestuariicola]MBN7803059.1 alpha/beta hydrolase fold domain-containing protein [Algoriphagus aestuariicola]
MKPFAHLFLMIPLVLSVVVSFAQQKPIEALDAEKLKGKVEHDLVVAQDGSGHFRTISEAIKAVRVYLPKPITVHIKPGIYREKLVIPGQITHVTFWGEDPGNTIISLDDYAAKDNMGTFETYTLKVLGSDLIFKNLTIQNTAGPVGQAVALHAEGDRLVFENCRFLGNQDTMLASGEGSRQLYKNCYIEGTTDFIFGSATAFFENCTIHSKADSYITAASTPQWASHGFVFMDCKLTADDGVGKVYLGRPWRDFAKTVFVMTEMGEHILPIGWHDWGREATKSTVFYAELQSQGPGSGPDNRADWTYLLDPNDLEKYQKASVLSGLGRDADFYGNRWYGYEKDSSFNLEASYQKDKKSFPQIMPVQLAVRPGIEMLENKVYKRLWDRSLKLDVFKPKIIEKTLPTVLLVHGGGWKSGDKILQRSLAIRLAERGFVAVPVEYRLSPEAQYPAAVQDLKEAVRWIKAHASEFGVDSSRIAISGSSAGAQLASLMGLSSLSVHEGNSDLSPSSRVQAVINMDGILAFHHPESLESKVAAEWLGGHYEQIPEIWEEASPAYLKNPTWVPMLFINSQYPRFHAGRDELAEKLRKAGVSVEIHTLPDTPHPFWLYQPWFEPTVDLITSFLKEIF